MMFLNEHEVEVLAETFDAEDSPNLFRAARALEHLMDWTNRNSDGWAYWKLPLKAAESLMGLLEQAGMQYRRAGEIEDLTDADMEKLFRPIQKLLIEQGADPGAVLFPKLPPAPVSFAPDASGVIDIGGVKSEFRILLADDSVTYQQWGADEHVLGERVDLLESMADAARLWAEENLCRTCHERLLDDGEGYDGECGDCADRSEADRVCPDCDEEWVGSDPQYCPSCDKEKP